MWLGLAQSLNSMWVTSFGSQVTRNFLKKATGGIGHRQRCEQDGAAHLSAQRCEDRRVGGMLLGGAAGEG